jgi:dUTP pyrophosphatase
VVQELPLRIKKLAGDVIVPKYAKEGDVGMDLYSREHRTLEQGEPYMFKLGFSTEFPAGWVGLVQDRSSMGYKGVRVLGGVMDPGYRGEWGVILVNLTNKEIVIQPGDRIAQVVFKPIGQANVEVVSELGSSERGAGGFGSTGR